MNPNDMFAPAHLNEDIARAAQGDIVAAIRTGYRYFTGEAGKKDNSLARQYFIMGALGVADASPWIHYMTLQSAALHKKSVPIGALDQLSSLADTGDVIAVTLLGRVMERGWHGAGNDIVAAKAAYLSAGSQFALALTFLGELYIRRRHVTAAQDLFQQASEKNETRSIVDLALIYLGKRRVVTGKQLLKAAVWQNNCRAMYRLAILYQQRGGGARPRQDLARHLLRRASRMGYQPATALLHHASVL